MLIPVLPGISDPHGLSDDLRARLGSVEPSALVEFVAELAGCTNGHRQMIFWLHDGRLEHSELGHRRITKPEFNRLARMIT